MTLHALQVLPAITLAICGLALLAGSVVVALRDLGGHPHPPTTPAVGT